MADYNVLNDAIVSETPIRARALVVNADAGPTPPAPVATPPVVAVVSPAAGSAITAFTPLVFSVTDDTGLFRRIIVVADFPYIGIREVVHDGDTFGPTYSEAVNTRSTISGGYQYSVTRDGGWPASPRLIPYAIDREGTENT